MGHVTIDVSDETLRKAAGLAAAKGMPLHVFLAYQLDELVAANDRYERARASVRNLYPDTDEGAGAQSSEFFDRWRHRSS